MSASEFRVQRAMAWWESLPADRRPDPLDVELAARLDVTLVEVMGRIHWHDEDALGRVFSGLVAVLRSDAAGDRPPTAPPGFPLDAQQDEDVDLVDELEQPEEPATAAPEQDLDTWIASLRDQGVDVPITDDLAEQLRGLSGADGLERVVVSQRNRRTWRHFVQAHGAELSAVLGLEPSTTLPVAAPTAPTGPTGLTSAEGFTGGVQPGPSNGTPRPVACTPSEAGGTELSWSAPDPRPEVCIYRVVARADTRPWNLDLGDRSRLVTATYDTSAVDPEPFTGGKGFYAVFLNTGPDRAGALASVPVLWAEGTAIRPVQDAQVRRTGHRVSGRWTVPPAISRVEVLRVPVQEPPISRAHFQTEFLISGSRPGENREGFTDEDVPSGAWEYRIYACAEIDGRTLRSAPVISLQDDEPELPVVEDLQVQLLDEEGLFRISWTPLNDPNLSVRIHKRLTAPQDRVAGQSLDAAALEREGFTDETVITDPDRRTPDGRDQVDSPLLPRETRIWFTAVTVPRARDQRRVSAAFVWHRVGSIPFIELSERVDEQFLSFAWPDGADLVNVHDAVDGTAAEPADLAGLPRLAQLPRQKHEEHGGIRLGPLPAEGKVLYVAGLALHDGRDEWGPASRVEYPGLTRLRYEVATEVTQLRKRFRRVDELTSQQLQVRSEDRDATVPLVLVSRPDRLPLFVKDGDRVFSKELHLPRAAWRTWEGVVLEGLSGYLRLFVDVEDAKQEQYAVLDPPLSQLRWGGP